MNRADLRPGERTPRPVPAVAADLTRPAVVLAVVCALALVALGLAYRGATRPGRLDQVVGTALRERWRSGPVASTIDGLVTPGPALAVVALLAVACLVLRRPRLAVVAALGPLGSYVVTTALKSLVGRTIHGGNLSFPSGHAAFATAVGLVVGLLITSRLRPGRTASALVVLGAAALCWGVMAVDQVVLDAHYPTDTVGGLLAAVALVLGLALGVDAALGYQRGWTAALSSRS